MFCPECGKSNPEGLQHCQYCNAELIDNSPRNTASQLIDQSAMLVGNLKAKTKKMGKTPKIICACVICVVVAVSVLLGVGSALSSPERVAKQYFEAYAAQDWESVYDYLIADEKDPFLNKAMFVYSMKNRDMDQMKITNYEITELSANQKDSSLLSISPLSIGYGGSNSLYNDSYEDDIDSDSSDSKLVKEYLVTYLSDDGTGKHTMPITLYMQEERSFLFFKKYKVSAEPYITSCTIEIPKDTKATLNSVDLSPYAETDEDSQYTTINIRRIFQNDYILSVTSPMIEYYSRDISVYDGSSISVSVSDLSVNESLIDSVKTIGNQLITALYVNSTSGKKLDSFTNLNITNTDDCKAIMDQMFNDHGLGEKNVNITSFEMADGSIYTDSLGMFYRATFYYTYTGTHVSQSWTSEIEETPMTNASGTVKIIFTIDQDGNLKPYSCPYFLDTIVRYSNNK